MQVSPAPTLQFLQNAPENGAVAQLVVLLHGYGRDASLMKKLSDEVRTRLPQALILMPHAPEDMEEHVGDDNVLRVPEQLRDDHTQEFTPGSRRKWFSIRGASLDELTHRILVVTDLVNDFITHHMQVHGLQDKDVALMGFSQGGVVALYTAYMRAQSVACVVGHSTLFMPGMTLTSKMPTLYLYGLDDEEFPPSRYEEAARLLSAQVPDTTVRAVPGLRHTTNAQSRAMVADYIASYFQTGIRFF